MIFAKSKRFVFIKGRKVASTSVEIALSALCDSEDIITPITPIDERERLRLTGVGAQDYGVAKEVEDEFIPKVTTLPISSLRDVVPPRGRFYNHMPLQEVLREQGEDDRLALKIYAVERNPYSKIISWANMELSFESYTSGGAMTAPQGRIKDLLERAIPDRRIAIVRNIDLYRDSEGRIAAEIIRFENLDDDFRRLLREMGAADAPIPPVKKGIQSGRIDPRELFTRAQLDSINEMFRDEFEAFGYRKL